MRAGALITGLSFLALSVQGQTDFPISLVSSSPAQINPASPAMLREGLRVHTYYKGQSAFSGHGISAAGASADYLFPELKMGLAATFYSNALEKTALRDFNFLLSYAYRLDLGERNALSFGLQAGYKQLSFSLHELSFGSQYDPAYAGGYNPNSPTPSLGESNKNIFDASFGVIWRGLVGNQSLLTAGASAFHLIPFQTDFLREEKRLAPKFVGFLQLQVDFGALQLEPAILYHQQNKDKYVEMGALLRLNKAEAALEIALHYRSPKALIPSVGIAYQQFVLRFAMEYYLQNQFSKILNFSLLYTPRWNRQVLLLEDFRDI